MMQMAYEPSAHSNQINLTEIRNLFLLKAHFQSVDTLGLSHPHDDG